MDKVAAYKALIGTTHQDYYLSYFRRAEERGYAPVSWHWPVFFAGVFWLLWRRQYYWALVSVAVVFSAGALGGACAAAFESPAFGDLVNMLITGGFGLIYLPMKANAIYYNWAKNSLEKITAQLPPQAEKQLEALTQMGGTNNNIPIALFVFIVVVAMLAGPPPELASQ